MDDPMPDVFPWLDQYYFNHAHSLYYKLPPASCKLALPTSSVPSPKLSRKQIMYNPNIESWLHVKLLYVRVINSCSQLPEEAPDSLLILCPPRDICTELEVNGGRIAPSERCCFSLRRDRVDPGASEATYVSTNNLRVAGDHLFFEVYDKDEVLAYGELARKESYFQDTPCFKEAIAGPEVRDMLLLRNCSSPQKVSGTVNKSGNHSRNGTGYSWSLDCACGTLDMGSFRNNNNTNSNVSSSSFLCKGKMPATMELYVAGMCSGLPLVLTATLQLSCVRKRTRRSCARLYSSLVAIPEAEECSQSYCSQNIEQASEAVAIDGLYRDHSVVGGQVSGTAELPNEFLYTQFGNECITMGDEDEEELSWFNAGVRVGVGIGLGLCLGLGIGLGLLIRPFRKRLFQYK